MTFFLRRFTEMRSKSLRWKLLSWNALMMCGLALAAGVLLYANVRRNLEREVDGRIWSHAIGLSRVVTPIGGLAFLIGWAILVWSVAR